MAAAGTFVQSRKCRIVFVWDEEDPVRMADSAEPRSVSSFMDPFKSVLVDYLMPESCYDQFFLNFNLLDGKKPARLLLSCLERERLL